MRRLVKEDCPRSPRQDLDAFTDWSRRPLTEAQLTYAVADVTHLRVIYEFLSKELVKSGRTSWVEEEEAILLNPETYITRPQEAWMKVKTRTSSGRFMAVVRELARFREGYAQARNIPRSRVYKDDALLELASTKPTNYDDLGKSRLLLREARRGDIADGIIAAVKAGMDCKPEDFPKIDAEAAQLQVNTALADLLRVLLKAKSEEAGVAAKLIASSSDLDRIAAGKRELAAMQGWRHEVFGADALRLARGEIALSARGGAVRVVPVG